MAGLNITLPTQESQTEANLRRWEELLNDPDMARFEGRIETDRHGQIIMSPPPAPFHGGMQYRISRMLDDLMTGGYIFNDCSISTADGVRAADVVWASRQLVRQVGRRIRVCFTKAPEICVEIMSPKIMSPSNTESQIGEKMALYFDAGAVEVWICGLDGDMRFFTSPDKPTADKSVLCPEFPGKVELEFD